MVCRCAHGIAFERTRVCLASAAKHKWGSAKVGKKILPSSIGDPSFNVLPPTFNHKFVSLQHDEGSRIWI